MNDTADRLPLLGSEVTRVANDAEKEGQLGLQATVQGEAVTWHELKDNVNITAANSTNQARQTEEALRLRLLKTWKRRLNLKVMNIPLNPKNIVNNMFDQRRICASEVTHVSEEIVTKDESGYQAVVRGVTGMWNELVNVRNTMATNRKTQVRSIA